MSCVVDSRYGSCETGIPSVGPNQKIVAHVTFCSSLAGKTSITDKIAWRGKMSPTHRSFWRGFREGFPFILVVVPFALLFGVVGTAAGLDIVKLMAFSAIVFAGAAQFTAIQLMTEQAPVAVVILTALAVNLRLAMYSASLAPHLGPAPLWKRLFVAYILVDQPYAASIREYEENPDMTIDQKVAFFIGVATPLVPAWMIASLVGGLTGQMIPESYSLDFALPITFLALVAPMLRTLAHVAAAVVSILVSLACYSMPLNLWLLLAAGLAMLTGVAVEKLIGRIGNGTV